MDVRRPWLVQVLGPIRALDDTGADRTPSGPLQRRLLALLVLTRGRSVAVDTIIDVLWPGAQPKDPVAAAQHQVSRLRHRLGDGLLTTTADGYRLNPDLIELDVDVLADALRSGDAIDPGEVAVVEATLAGWHGPAYPELADADGGRAEATRLDELRIRAREAVAAATLAAGDSSAAIASLLALSDDEPLRERPRSLLISALMAAGRRAEALRVYDDFRRLVGDELGIEPSLALQAQHAEVLAGATGALPTATPWTTGGRLPAPASALIGREAQANEIARHLSRDRVVTLVGPGGVGKTRLAIEVAHRLRRDRPDRAIVLCELASATAATVIDTVGASLAIDQRVGADPIDRLATVLGDGEIVLVLDNCEHVVGPVAELVERLVAAGSGVRVLATSRERLRVAGEQVYPVPTLPADDDGPAARLFIERAQAVAPGFVPDDRDRTIVGEIVRRLDGLPLAIELAAARLYTHDLAEVAEGLGARFALLTEGRRTATRHGSLTAAIAWSTDLLDEPLRAIFTRLSAFTTPFTATDAAAVCDLDVVAAADALAQLTERSLVVRSAGRRYSMLESLRAYGAEQLAIAGEIDAIEQRHAHHFVAWVEQTDRRLLEDGGAAAADLDAAVPDLRTALDHLLRHRDIETAGRLVGPLLDFGFLGQRPDVLGWADQVAAADPDDASPHAAMVRIVGAYGAWLSGDAPSLGHRARHAQQLIDSSGGRASGSAGAEAATLSGSVALFEGRLADATKWYRRAADLATTFGDRAQYINAISSELLALGYHGDAAVVARSSAVLDEVGSATSPYAAYAWYCAGESDLSLDIERARARLTRAIDLAESSGAALVVGLARGSRASIDARSGDPTVAAEEFQRLVVRWRAAGVWATQWTMLRSIAVLLGRLGRAHDAAVLEGAVRATTEGHRIFGADEHALAALSARLLSDLGAAAYQAAKQAGAMLDGDSAVEHALAALARG